MDIGAFDVNGPPYASPSVPTVIYQLLVTAPGAGTNENHGLCRLARVENRWVSQNLSDVPDDIDIGTIDTPASRGDVLVWMSPVSIRRIEGGDAILFAAYSISQSGFTFWTRYRVFRDGPDADPFADHWTEAVEVPGIEAMTMDDRGNILGRRVQFQQPSGPYTLDRSDGFVTLVDTDGDAVGDSPDPTSEYSIPTTGPLRSAYGPADIDLGSNRAVINCLVPAVANIDSRGRIVAGSARPLWRKATGDGFKYSSFQPTFGHDGLPVDFVYDGLSSCGPIVDAAVATWDDLDFDGYTNDGNQSTPLEVRPTVTNCQLPEYSVMGGVSVAELPEIPTPNGNAQISFADFGDFPNNETFKFRFGGQEFDHVWISKNGIVSFTAPVFGTASFANLSKLHGAIAPCWSDKWDTSKTRIFAGLAPVQKSFVTGERALAFAIEWRGLRAPDWDDSAPIEKDRSISMRLLLFSDGSFRTDFGAFDSTELGNLPLVVGYAGPGAHPTSESTDASAHSWGATWAGTRQERLIGEEFGVGHPSDLDHLFVRWAGYPERLDTPGPKPLIINPLLKNASKLVLTAKNSNITPTAMVLVDNLETFTLTRSASGKKWMVGKRSTSQPGGRSVNQIWSDGQPHQIVVINSDGEQSDPATLTP